jgi:phosphoglycerate dehydrogenase-like enzyme
LNYPPLINTVKKKSDDNPVKIVLVVPEHLPKLYDKFLLNISGGNIIKAKDNRDSIFSKIKGANALIGCPRSIFDDDLLNQAGESLKWVHNPGAGIEHFLTEGLINSNIIFTNGRIIQGTECADHALALLLSLTRNIVRTLKNDVGSNMPRPIELLNKKALVIGVGGIGLGIAERLSAFGVEVTGVDDDYIPMLSFLKKTARFEDLPNLVGDADIVFMSAPHTMKTNKVIDKSLLMKFKKGAFFINVSRGGTVDTDALTLAIEDDILGGVGLDVTDPEPLPSNHNLRSKENVLITSHIAGLSEFNRERSTLLIRENIIRFIRGENLLNIVNKIAGY